MFNRVAAAFSIGVLLCALSIAQASTNAECLTCHSANGFSSTGSDGKQVSLHVDGSMFSSSIHGGKSCVDCHIDLADKPFPHKTSADPVKCSRCHTKGNHNGAPQVSPMDSYRDSVHGLAAADGDGDAPGCKDCHGSHDIRKHTDPLSRTYRTNIPATCARCHSDSRITRDHKMTINQPVKLYDSSVHGKLLEKQGVLNAAVCTDCHGVHGIKAAKNSHSSVNHVNIPETCGKCHEKAYDEYKNSIHGQARDKGVKDAPVCTDCHGEHSIQKPSSPDSSVYPTHVVATCSKCHENVRMQKKYGLAGGRLASYTGSFHGVANKYGETTVANCATCHGAHSILPSTNKKSAVHKANLPTTCGKCHPGAGANFANGDIHLMPSPTKDKKIYWIKKVYGMFVLGMIASFAGYIGLDLLHRFKRRGRH